MTEIHQCKCDKCGKIENLRNSRFTTFLSPEGWYIIDEKNYCGKCTKELKQFIKNWRENE
jgi:hypothetical protein